jgi:hypothetical protein
MVEVGDRETDPDRILSFMLMPDRDIFIGYHSQQHEQSTAGLLKRLAALLGCTVELS